MNYDAGLSARKSATSTTTYNTIKQNQCKALLQRMKVENCEISSFNIHPHPSQAASCIVLYLKNELTQGKPRYAPEHSEPFPSPHRQVVCRAPGPPHGRAAARLGGGDRGTARARHGPDRQRQDAGGLPVGHQPARHRRLAARRDQGPLHLPAEGAEQRRAAQPHHPAAGAGELFPAGGRGFPCHQRPDQERRHARGASGAGCCATPPRSSSPPPRASTSCSPPRAAGTS